MKKLILATLLASTSFTAAVSAEEFDMTQGDWERMSNTAGVSYAKANGFNFGYASVFLEGTTPNFMIGFFNSSDCVTGQVPSHKQSEVWFVENTPVNMSFFCNEGSLLALPKSKAGHEHIIEQFRTRDEVQIGDGTWNAKGFTQQLNNIKFAATAL